MAMRSQRSIAEQYPNQPFGANLSLESEQTNTRSKM